ncbi:hypothetical protein DFP72DRAFT_992589 [Ephemerocybe angulata]|uniref:CxC2-like cysteine cluster KDZ transposase-associated domain-containing protein n=1 Tax=Ephemerocybe angulata TaxID=980116 RepID=A0A8H6LX41_9AGAR|nr:hypothetical protein DFP72DRAFT_992589 [Tulosesus angulatus]
MPQKGKKRARTLFQESLDEPEGGSDSQPGYMEQHTDYFMTTESRSEASSVVFVPPSPVKKQAAPRTAGIPLVNLRSDAGPSSGWAEAEDPQPFDSEMDTEDEPRASAPSDNPLAMFTPRIDVFLDELLRLDFLANGDACLSCSSLLQQGDMSVQMYRCRDCGIGGFWCRTCVISAHCLNPLHRIEVWNDLYWDRCSLKSLGLRLQLGHPPGELCENPRSAPNDDFVIIDSDSVHEVGLDFCNCEKTAPSIQQLLRARLFPATVQNPKSAATFRVLETFQMLSHTGKISAHEFMIAIQRRGDNTMTGNTRDRYPEFRRMVHEWRFLRMMKRAGRGHEPGGWAATSPGECAVACPACPYPDVNLPENWLRREFRERWKDALFLAVDANFRLARKDVSSDERDPGLIDGTAYIVNETQFKAFLLEYGAKIPDDKSTCNNHDAIKSASMGRGKGLAATGMGTAQCSRHDMKRPTSCGDLLLGERYINMDYFVISTLRRNIPRIVRISYDIACQWRRWFEARCAKYPPNPVSPGHQIEFSYLIPKFHLPAHIQPCQLLYSHNLLPRVGRTDGEAPERGWSKTNLLASSTREMGPGARRDTLDDTMGDMNWAKAVEMDDLLVRRAKEALKGRDEHVEAFKLLAGALPQASVNAWTKMALTWEADVTKPNPYEPSKNVLTASNVRLQLAEEDRVALANDNSGAEPVHKDIPPSLFIHQGIDLEDATRRHSEDMARLAAGSTDLKRSKLLERGNALKRQFDAWVLLQNLYMPATTAHRLNTNELASVSDTSATMDDVRFLLPSEVHGLLQFDKKLSTYEFKYRVAQAYATLSDLRGLILMRQHMLNSKKKYASGTAMMTRSNSLIQDLYARIHAQRRKYDEVYSKLQILAPAVSTKVATLAEPFIPLLDTDIQGLKSFEEGAEGHKKLTWIWNVRGVGETADQAADTALRVEFCRARARAHRWQEECLLLAEEMRRTVRFWRWDASRWQRRADAFEEVKNDDVKISPEDAAYPKLMEVARRETETLYGGKRAYAHRQCAIRKALMTKADDKFKDLINPLDGESGGASIFVGASDANVA